MNQNLPFIIVPDRTKNGKAVVSASKKMIAEHLPELLLQKETRNPFFMKLLHVPLFLL